MQQNSLREGKYIAFFIYCEDPSRIVLLQINLVESTVLLHDLVILAWDYGTLIFPMIASRSFMCKVERLFSTIRKIYDTFWLIVTYAVSLKLFLKQKQ